METIHSPENSRFLRIAFVLAIGLHLIALYGPWKLTPSASPALIDKPVLRVSILTPQNSRRETSSVATGPQQPAASAGVARERKVKRGTPDVAQAPGTSAADPVEQAAPPAASGPRLNVDDILGSVRRDASTIDREARAAAPNRLPSLNNSSSRSKFEQSFTAAGVSRSVTLETITLADGRKMTKVIGPHGTYCVTMESNSGAGGLDPTQNGIRKKTTTCPG